MNEATRKGELEFGRAREELERAIEAHLAGRGASNGQQELPAFKLEKGNVTFTFYPEAITSELVWEALRLIKRHIENVRVHTFEPGYIVFQAMSDNLYDTSEVMAGIKFRFAFIGSTCNIEITRRANLIQDELQVCIELFKLFYPGQVTSDPSKKLIALGVQLYKPGLIEESSAKSNFVGYRKTRQEIEENLVLPLLHPETFKGVAALTRGDGHTILPKAILFEGPPGVGKTTMARIASNETKIPLVYVPIESIMSKYFGESASNMAAIFDAAAELEKVILFLDEIDSLAGSRDDGMFEATRRVLSVLLRKIDGFESKEGIITVGATNRSEDLDSALLSRFDNRICFNLPDEETRAEIFSCYAHHLSSDECKKLAAISDGLSGRSIQDVCEYTERRWARTLISSRAAPSAPPAHLYLDVTSSKLN